MNTTASPDTTSKKSTGDLSLAFDVGHSSIGWAVLQNIDASAPSILGCGAVIFAADDCLASQRRTFRRQRRHVRSTRQRIARMKALLAHLGVLSREQLDQPGCAWPWQLAARALCGGPLLNWSELWDVLRGYAHNRGYDGNRRWSAADIETLKEDTEKEENALTSCRKMPSRQWRRLLQRTRRRPTRLEKIFDRSFQRFQCGLPAQDSRGRGPPHSARSFWQTGKG